MATRESNGSVDGEFETEDFRDSRGLARLGVSPSQISRYSEFFDALFKSPSVGAPRLICRASSLFHLGFLSFVQSFGRDGRRTRRSCQQVVAVASMCSRAKV